MFLLHRHVLILFGPRDEQQCVHHCDPEAPGDIQLAGRISKEALMRQKLRHGLPEFCCIVRVLD